MFEKLKLHVEFFFRFSNIVVFSEKRNQKFKYLDGPFRAFPNIKAQPGPRKSRSDPAQAGPAFSRLLGPFATLGASDGRKPTKASV